MDADRNRKVARRPICAADSMEVYEINRQGLASGPKQLLRAVKAQRSDSHGKVFACPLQSGADDADCAVIFGFVQLKNSMKVKVNSAE